MKPKVSLEMLGKIEQAIKDKYGEKAIVDPRQFWTKEKEEEFKKEFQESLEKERKIEQNIEKTEKDGFLISKNLLIYKNGDGCPVCKKYSLNNSDKVYLTKFECCYKCYVDFVENREDRWQTGWRPNK